MADIANNGSDWRGWLEEQFKRHRNLVRAVIWNHLGRGGESHLIDELAAETWARAVRRVQSPDFDAGRNFAPWVCAIAVNVCREHCRRVQPASGSGWRPDDLQARDNFKQTQDLLELHQALAQCLNCLGELERQIYELCFEQGLSGRAAAEALGVPESTFREKLLAGLFAKLARCLAAKGFDEVLPSFSAHRARIGQRSGERRMS